MPLAFLCNFAVLHGTSRLYIFMHRPTNSFGCMEMVSLLNLPRTQRFEAEYRGCPTSNLYVYIVHVHLVAFLITVINDKPRLINVKRVFIL